MSTYHHQHLVKNPKITTSSSAISTQQRPQESHSITGNGQLSLVATAAATVTKAYPSATAEYEEVVKNSELFWEKLKSFHKLLGTKFMIPTIGGKALDLHCLFVEVTSRGGLEKVIRDRRWKEVVVVFKFPTSITSASFVLRKYYLSLLHHFEQVYYFHKQEFSIPTSDPMSMSLVSGSTTQEEDDCTTTNQSQSQECPILQLGSLVSGTIDGKFDDGYLITVNLGSDQLKGVLYHIPVQVPQNSLVMHSHGHRKRSRAASRDPSHPKSNRSGYNFFFAENYARLKPSYHGQEKSISKKIGVLWNNLTDAEKQVYQEKGLKDKERYRTEMMEYKSSNASTPQ